MWMQIELSYIGNMCIIFCPNTYSYSYHLPASLHLGAPPQIDEFLYGNG